MFSQLVNVETQQGSLLIFDTIEKQFIFGYSTVEYDMWMLADHDLICDELVNWGYESIEDFQNHGPYILHPGIEDVVVYWVEA